MEVDDDDDDDVEKEEEGEEAVPTTVESAVPLEVG